MKTVLLVVFAVMVAAAPGAFAQDIPDPPDPVEELAKEIRGLIEKLGSKNWKERNKTSRKLEAFGDEAMLFLAEAREHEDTEIRVRVEGLLKKIIEKSDRLIMKKIGVEATFGIMDPNGKRRYIKIIADRLKAKAKPFLARIILFETDEAVREAALRNLAKIEKTSPRESFEAYLEKLGRSTPRWAHILLGDMARRENDFDTGIEHYEDALKLGKMPPTALRSLAGLYRIKDNFEKSTSLLENAIQSMPPSNDKLLIYKDLYGSLLEIKDLFRAMTAFAGATRDFPADEELYIDFIAELEKRQHHSEAVEVCKRARRTMPDSVRFTIRLAELYEAGGNSRSALALYDGVLDKLKRVRRNTDAFVRHVGEMHLAGGNREKAFDTWRIILGPNPRIEQYSSLARMFSLNGFSAKARKVLRKAIALYKGDSRLPTQLFETFVGEKDLLGARKLLYEEEIDIFGGDKFRRLFSRALDTTAEVNAFLKAELDLTPHEASFATSYYDGLIVDGLDRRALGVLLRFMCRFPNDTGLKSRLADAYMRRKQFSGARQLYMELAESNPGSIEYAIGYAAALRAEGLEDNATAVLKGACDYDGLSDDRAVALADDYLARDEAARACDLLGKLAAKKKKAGYTMPGDLSYRYGLYLEAAGRGKEAAGQYLRAHYNSRYYFWGAREDLDRRLKYLLKIKGVKTGLAEDLETEVHLAEKDSEKTDPLFRLFMLHWFAGEYEDTLEVLDLIGDEKALFSPSGLETLRGLALVRLGRHDEARKVLAGARRKDRFDPRPVLLLGRINALKGNKAAAEKRYNAALALRPVNEDAWAQAAGFFEMFGQVELAHAIWTRIDKTPTPHAYANAAAYLRIAISAEKTGDFKKAAQYYSLQMIAAQSGSYGVDATATTHHVAAGLEYARAKVFEAAGSNDKALHHYGRSLRLMKTPRAMNARWKLLVKLGKTGEAAKAAGKIAAFHGKKTRFEPANPDNLRNLIKAESARGNADAATKARVALDELLKKREK